MFAFIVLYGLPFLCGSMHVLVCACVSVFLSQKVFLKDYYLVVFLSHDTKNNNGKYDQLWVHQLSEDSGLILIRSQHQYLPFRSSPKTLNNFHTYWAVFTCPQMSSLISVREKRCHVSSHLVIYFINSITS